MDPLDGDSQTPARPSSDGDTGDIPSLQRPKLRQYIGVMLVVYWVVLFISTHIPYSSEGPPIPGADKLIHFVGFGILGLLFALWVALRRTLTLAIIITIVVGIGLYGIVDELLQIPVGRDCELMDWVADLVGASAGVGLVTWLSKTRR